MRLGRNFLNQIVRVMRHRVERAGEEEWGDWQPEFPGQRLF
jgi:hypothetical protein